MQKTKNNEYDLHIVEALKSLPVPLKTFDNHDVLFDENKRNETIFEHIANKKHHLHVKDIIEIPKLLKNKVCRKNDRAGHKYRTYIGKRGKIKERAKYLKIVTHLQKDKHETIVTICVVKKLTNYNK